MEQAEIRKLYHKDTDGTIHQYYPLVHEDAVRDSEGNKLSEIYVKNTDRATIIAEEATFDESTMREGIIYFLY